VAALRLLKGVDVNGADLNDIILGCAGGIVFLMMAGCGYLCYLHSKHPEELDPYTTTLWRYTHLDPCNIRKKPELNSYNGDQCIRQNAVICVSEELTAKDSRKYLRLADGRGWVPEMIRGVSVVGPALRQIDVTLYKDAMAGYTGASDVWEFFFQWGWQRYDLGLQIAHCCGLQRSEYSRI